MADDEEEEGGGGDSFRMLFVTLSMILLAFFILLNSMSTLSEEKSRVALGSLLGSFGLLPGAASVDQSSQVLRQDNDLLSSGSGFSVFKKIENIVEHLAGGNTNHPNQIFATFDKKTGEIKIVAADELMFAPGKSIISPRMFSLLSEVSKMVNEFHGTVKVIGHTDKRGKTADNWKLSLQRGTTVARNIGANVENSKGRVSALGLSYYKPVDVLDPSKRGMSNRRVEIVVTTKQDGEI